MKEAALTRLRIAMLAALFVLLLLRLFMGQVPETPWQRPAADTHDPRPPLYILFIGNSRTFVNDMPTMVRKIADSAHSPKKYEITMQAPPGIALEDHWNNARTQSMLKEKWDFVVLQGRSNEQCTDDWDQSFHYYGQKLAALAKAHGSLPVLFVSWRYSENFNSRFYQEWPELKLTLQDRMQKSYALLSYETGAPEVNVGKVWEELRHADPAMQLYQDDTHPSIYGSYLTALMFYRFFSHDDLAHVTYVPPGISPQDANLIKLFAQAP